jgi:hypothetical protein
MFAASKSGRAAPAAPTADVNFGYVPLLLNTTSTNGQNNQGTTTTNGFLDSSTNNFTITRNGSPTQGSITPYWPNGQWSNYFSDFQNQTLTYSPSASNFLFAGDFTVETWCWTPGGGFSVFLEGTSVYFGFNIDPSGNKFDVYLNSATPNFSPTATIPLSQWMHVALVRSGSGSNNIKIYLNGTALATTATNTSTLGYSSPSFARTGGGAAGAIAYLSNLRVANGAAVYTSNFTPPTAPLGVISGGQNPPTGTQTKLLTCQSNRFIDNSSNNLTLTLNGTPRVQAFQPFSPTASYTTALYGGSGYFNGSTDYLSLASNEAFGYGTGNFTEEMWIYPTASNWTSGNFYISDHGGNLLQLQYYLNVLYWNSGAITGTAIPANTWSHIAVARNSTTVVLYLNGASIGTTSSSTNFATTTLTIGAYGGAGAIDKYEGYISNLRLVKGTAVYTGNFTPPTLAPLTTAGSTSAASYPSTTNVNTSFAAANTSLLLNMTNAGIYDAAVQNNVITVGNAQVSIAQAQFPPSSILFDGSGDYLLLPDSVSLQLGSGGYTIEFWLYPVSLSGSFSGIIDTRTSGGVDTNGFAIYFSTSQLRFRTNGSDILTYSSFPTGAWTYVAITRSGSGSNNTKLFINGTQQAQATNTTSFTQTSRFAIGTTYPLSGDFYNGYIQDLRLTKGVGRTIAPPPPTAAFPTR